MKKDNNLIRITNSETGEVFYFTKDYCIKMRIGCTQSAMPLIKDGNSVCLHQWKYEIVDGSNILYKDINKIKLVLL